MLKVKYTDLKETGNFEHDGETISWISGNIDHFMGFTIMKIKATEKEDGYAELQFFEKFVMGSDNKEKTCKDSEYVGYMIRDLKELLESKNIKYYEVD